MAEPRFNTRLLSTDGRYRLPVYSNVLSSDESDHLERNSELAWDITAHNRRREIYPIAAGNVVYIEKPTDPRGGSGGYGWNVIIDHGSCWAWYCHLEAGSIRADIDIGTELGADEAFARVGDTGITDFHHHTHLLILKGTAPNVYQRIRPDTIWDRSQMAYMKYATSDSLDRYPIGDDMANTVMGVHTQGWGNIEWTGKLAPRAWKVMDVGQDSIDEIRRRSPGPKIILRHYVPDSEMHDRIQANPEEAAEWSFQKILLGPRADYYQIANEVHQHPIFDKTTDELLLDRGITALVAYDLRMMELADNHGMKMCVGNFSVGNPRGDFDDGKLGDWPYYYDALDKAVEGKHLVNCHQYSKYDFWHEEFPPDWYIHRLEHTVIPRLDKVPGHNFDRLGFVVGEFGLTRKLNGGDAGGWQIWKTFDEYKQDLISIFSYTAKFSRRVLGYCCYNTFAFSPWETHEMREMNAAMAEYYQGNPLVMDPFIYDEEPPPPDKVLYKARVSTNLNLRQQPIVADNIIRVMGKDEMVEVVGTDEGWSNVIDYLGNNGWAASRYLIRIDDPPPDKTLEERVADNETKIEGLTLAINAAVEAHRRTSQVLNAALLSIEEGQKRLDALETSTASLDARVTALEDDDPPLPPTNRRFSPAVDHMNMGVIDENSNAKWRVKDVFTTLNGQTYRKQVPDSVDIYQIPEWAIDAYISNRGSDPDDAGMGAETHIFVLVVDKDGNYLPNRKIEFIWPGSVSANPPGAEGPVYEYTKERLGWCDIYITSHYVPERGETGAHWVAVRGDGATEMFGRMSLPSRNHVSTFIVFEEQ